jgi:hypothetical protein
MHVGTRYAYDAPNPRARVWHVSADFRARFNADMLETTDHALASIPDRQV